jgi:pimeloyl-ACP methyl ester carboxylesterase
MKETLYILTDLWGISKASYIERIVSELAEKYNCKVFDSIELGSVDKRVYTKESLHRQFLEGGVDRAVERLLKSLDQPVRILAFSIGGLIAWKAAQRSANVKEIICFSSTRLRKEEIKPGCMISLYYGAEDPYSPKQEWLDKHDLRIVSIVDETHEFYRKSNTLPTILESLDIEFA